MSSWLGGSGSRRFSEHNQLRSLLAVALLAGFGSTVKAQTNFERVLSFGPVASLGNSPRGGLCEGSDGLLYGTTYAGGSSNIGLVFSVGKDGAGFRALQSLTNGYYPYAGVIEGADGKLYGTASAGGTHGGGTIFRLGKDGSGFVTLRNFDPAGSDGVAPVSGLRQGSDGVLYGTTSGGGSGNMGTVFRINTSGTVFSVVHTFTGLTNGVDGSYPAAGVIQGADGMLYGTTQTGGTNDAGTVFKMNLDGTGYSVIHQFAGAPTDGNVPSGDLVQGRDGVLYGTTRYGGANDLGMVFRVDTNGNNYSVLKSFSGTADGKQPLAGLGFGTNGMLYGTTRYGGSFDGGAAFRLGTNGLGFLVLHSFQPTNGDGAQPLGSLTLASDGSWYGTCYYGGDYMTNSVSGILFRLLPDTARVKITSIEPGSAGAQLRFAGGNAGQAYRILKSQTLAPGSWQAIGTNVAAIDGAFSYLDAGATTNSARFYRSASF